MINPSTAGKDVPQEPKPVAVWDSSEHDANSSENFDLQREVWDSTAVDPVLAKKMALVNNGVDEIGMTPWHWKLFCLNGFGYAVDSVSDLVR